MKKICFVTAARSEYGLLKWIMTDVLKDPSFEFQLIVTGGHLLESQGHTIDLIREDNFPISEIVDVQLCTDSKKDIAVSMGKMGTGFALAYDKLKPDLLVVLGDRYELLPICNSAFVMGIPIAHISGGDVTEGAIDNGIRNAVSMLATYHFPGVKDSCNNLIRMTGSEKNIWTVGEPGLDAFYRNELLNRDELGKQLELDVNKNWGLFTYHAETKETLEYNLNAVKYAIDSLLERDNLQIVMTYSNADFGGQQINELLADYANNNKDKLKLIPSLGQKRYLSFMRQAKIVVGNSSSGIVEAPFLGIPVINIGNRQKGRFLCDNIFQVSNNKEEINNKINYVLSNNLNFSNGTYWGDGHTSAKIIEVLRSI